MQANITFMLTSKWLCDKKSLKNSENFKKTLDRGHWFELYYIIDGVFPDGVYIYAPLNMKSSNKKRGGKNSEKNISA